MAKGALSLNLPQDAADRLAAKAKALGVSPAALAADMLGHLLDDRGTDAAPPTRSEDYAGPYADLEDALGAFSAELNRRLMSRAS